MPQTELIQFQIKLSSVYWDQPPGVQVLVNGVQKYDGVVLGVSEIVFTHKLELGKTQVLTIHRYNKTADQCVQLITGELQDQILTIEQIVIDGHNMRDIICSSSQFCPDYPQLWSAQQRAMGVELETNIIGETILGHNGEWRLEFTSPFWEYLCNKIDP